MPHKADPRRIKIVKDLKEKHPYVSIRKLSKLAHKEYPDIFSSIYSLKDFVAKTKTWSEHTALAEEAEGIGIPVEDINHYWYKGEHFSLHVKNDVPNYHDLRQAIVDSMDRHSPKYPKIKYPKIVDPHLFVCDPADIHLGKLGTSFETGEDYDNQIAVRRVKEGVVGTLNKAKSFNIDKIIFIAGNDLLHIDNTKRMTTSGTPQDTDGMWYDNFLIAKRLYVDILELLLSVAPVHVMFCPSNHDYASAFFLMDSITSWFRHCKGITFDVSISHRKYTTYGNNLISATHGDGAKEADLTKLASVESKDWSTAKHRYIYVHHYHHKKSTDYIGCTVETLRSPSGADSWHHRNGYQHSPKAIEGFIHHPRFGQVARLTHLF